MYKCPQEISENKHDDMEVWGHPSVPKVFSSYIGLHDSQSSILGSVAPGNVAVGTTGDQRGKHAPSNKCEDEFKAEIINHINSFRPQVSHYKREHAPLRRYLPAGLSVTYMHQHFSSQPGNECSYSAYFRVFKEHNISFNQPEMDLCQTCLLHTNKHGDEAEHNCENCDCEECQKYAPHKVRATKARDAIHKDTTLMDQNDNILVVTADMQKAISMPKLPTKQHYFARKIVLFNETFASPSKKGPNTCVLWHEGEAGRMAFDIASAYLHFVRANRNKEEITIYADNCTSQNKNWTLFSAMARIVNDPNHQVKKIAIKYLEPGHTYMAADSVHGNIAMKLNTKSSIFDFQDFQDEIKSSRKGIDCIVVNHTDMYHFGDQSRKNTKVRLRDVRVEEFRRGTDSLFTKYSHEDQEEFQEVGFLRKFASKEIMKLIADGESPVEAVPTMASARGISEDKKEIMQLVTVMPPHKQMFYKRLSVNNQAPPDLEVELGI